MRLELIRRALEHRAEERVPGATVRAVENQDA